MDHTCPTTTFTKSVVPSFHNLSSSLSPLPFLSFTLHEFSYSIYILLFTLSALFSPLWDKNCPERKRISQNLRLNPIWPNLVLQAVFFAWTDFSVSQEILIDMSQIHQYFRPIMRSCLADFTSATAGNTSTKINLQCEESRKTHRMLLQTANTNITFQKLNI